MKFISRLIKKIREENFIPTLFETIWNFLCDSKGGSSASSQTCASTIVQRLSITMAMGHVARRDVGRRGLRLSRFARGRREGRSGTCKRRKVAKRPPSSLPLAFSLVSVCHFIHDSADHVPSIYLVPLSLLVRFLFPLSSPSRVGPCGTKSPGGRSGRCSVKPFTERRKDVL